MSKVMCTYECFKIIFMFGNGVFPYLCNVSLTPPVPGAQGIGGIRVDLRKKCASSLAGLASSSPLSSVQGDTHPVPTEL